MLYDLEKMKFGAEIVGIVEDELQACLNDCPRPELRIFEDKLYQEYLADGKPKNVKAWLRPRLASKFLAVGACPKWICDPEWLWWDGEPMVFIGQLTVPDNEVSRTVGGECVVYVFSGRKKELTGKGGYEVIYRSVKQSGDMKGLVALVESESGPHTPANTKLVKRKG